MHDEKVAQECSPSNRFLVGQDIICFSHDWTGDPLSKTHLMRLLARENRILWVNSIGYRTPGLNRADVGRLWKKLKAAKEPLREVEKNIHVLNPLAVPAYGLRAAQVVNSIWLRQQVRWAMRKLRFSSPINWVFNPAAGVLARAFGEKTLIYQCVDEYSAFSGVASTPLLELEAKLLKESDLVIVSADKLYDSKCSHNPHTVVVRHGVDFLHFRKALDAATVVPPDIASLPRPIIGFFGLIADWVDVELMAAVAKRFSTGSMVVIGKATTDISVLEGLPNVHLLGRKPYAQLPAYCKGFDVALNPFRINELTLNANPLKIREYLAAGLPVVATNIPEVAVLGTCRIANTSEEFIREVGEALKVPGPRVEISETVRAEGWDARLAEIERHLVKSISHS